VFLRTDASSWTKDHKVCWLVYDFPQLPRS